MSLGSRRRGKLAAGIALLLAGAVAALAGEMPHPDRQGAMFKRIFSYDKDLRSSDKIVVIVVAENRSAPDVAQVASVFRDKGCFPAVVLASDLSDDLTATLTPKGAVIYVMPGVAYQRVKDFAAEKGFLSISGQASLAEAGHVSVSVHVQGDRPEIVVNLARLQSERHELSSELLNLARVIR